MYVSRKSGHVYVCICAYLNTLCDPKMNGVMMMMMINELNIPAPAMISPVKW